MSVKVCVCISHSLSPPLPSPARSRFRLLLASRLACAIAHRAMWLQTESAQGLRGEQAHCMMSWCGRPHWTHYIKSKYSLKMIVKTKHTLHITIYYILLYLNCFIIWNMLQNIFQSTYNVFNIKHVKHEQNAFKYAHKQHVSCSIANLTYQCGVILIGRQVKCKVYILHNSLAT